MDKRLLVKIEPIQKHAHECGWDTEVVPQKVDGQDAVQLVGTTVRGHPEASHPVEFGFSVAFAIRWETGRASALCLDGKESAIFVMTVEDGSGRYWHGPLRSYKTALDQPDQWTGVELPQPISR